VTTGEITLAEATAAAASLQEALPPSLHPLFTGVFLRSWALYDEYVYRLSLRVFEGAGLEAATREPGRASDVAVRAGLQPEQVMVPLDWLLRELETRHTLEREPAADGARWRRPDGPLPALPPDPIREEQTRLDPSWLPAYTLAETVTRDYVRFLRGEVVGEEVLFSPARFRLWTEYFSNANAPYAVNNRIGAIAVAEWLPWPGATILELGGGLASAACALLEELERTGRLGSLGAYHFTELVPAFLRRGQQTLQTRFPDLRGITFGPLDMNRPFEPQGVPPGSRSIVYAVNTLHVARDLDFTLAEIRGALAPGGLLVLSECVRMQPGQPLSAEFIFNLMTTFRSRRPDTPGQPPAGFLLPEQWQAALEGAGFTAVRFLPDVSTFGERFPRFHTAAIGATRP
jgi:SAM-dependent methyltransferase